MHEEVTNKSRRYGCSRSRRMLEKFPEKADRLARLTIERGFSQRTSKISKPKGEVNAGSL